MASFFLGLVFAGTYFKIFLFYLEIPHHILEKAGYLP